MREFAVWYTGEIMKVYRLFIQNFLRSIRDFTFYKEIPAKPLFFSLQFLYLLTFTILLIQTLFFTISAAFLLPQLPNAIERFQQRLETAYPRNLVVSVKNGTIETNAKQPVIINFPEITDNTPYKSFVTIDTTATQTDYTDKKTMILVTRDGVVYPEASNTRPYRFESASQFGDTIINSQTYEKATSRLNMVLDMLPMIAPWLLIAASLLIPILGSLIVVLWRMIILIILTGILLPVSMMFGNAYTYRDLYRMGMHGLTVPVILSLLLSLIGAMVPLAFASSFLLWMVIVLARISENKTKAR